MALRVVLIGCSESGGGDDDVLFRFELAHVQFLSSHTASYCSGDNWSVVYWVLLSLSLSLLLPVCACVIGGLFC